MKTSCWDCGGSGIKEVYRIRNIDGGICYTCKGTGIWYENAPMNQDQAKRREYLEEQRRNAKMNSLIAEYKAAKAKMVELVSLGQIQKAADMAQLTLDIKAEAKELAKQIKNNVYNVDSLFK